VGQALNVHRLHFAFTITFHYIFPQLTMGLALLLVYLKTKALRTGDEHYNCAARFWGRIFGINFAVGVVTGIPMEFQFGTNWAQFSRVAGGVIGQTLAMEGIFSFFLESSFLGLFLFGEKRLGRIGHWFSAQSPQLYEEKGTRRPGRDARNPSGSTRHIRMVQRSPAGGL
jgi:cytochrome d ubiquinol oxidase subunit I